MTDMPINNVFGFMMAARGITSNSTALEVIQALVDTIRQAKEEVANTAADVLYDIVDGAYAEYMDVLTETPGEYINYKTGEVISVPLLP